MEANENENKNAEYGLILPFWIDTEAYTDRDREMFSCGVEFQMVYEAVLSGKGWNSAIHAENSSRVRMALKHLGVPYKMEFFQEGHECFDCGWVHLSIPATKEQDCDS